jgi:ribonuclease BN (tRNA processing enzyme)
VNITFLGTNGWFDTPTGVTPCILIDSQPAYIVLDAGNGIYKLDRYITDTKKPIFVFISHLHLDHIFGLHILGKFHFPQGMTILTSKENIKPLSSFFRMPFTTPPEKLRTKTVLKEFDEKDSTLPFSVCGITLFHSSPNTGFRFQIEGKTIAYSGDTGICEKNMDLAKEADVLIHECSYEPGHPKNSLGHSAPEEVAQLAKDAHVGRLLLTHFDARIYTTMRKRKEAEKVAKKIFPNSSAMFDDQTIILA